MKTRPGRLVNRFCNSLAMIETFKWCEVSLWVPCNERETTGMGLVSKKAASFSSLASVRNNDISLSVSNASAMVLALVECLKVATNLVLAHLL